MAFHGHPHHAEVVVYSVTRAIIARMTNRWRNIRFGLIGGAGPVGRRVERAQKKGRPGDEARALPRASRSNQPSSPDRGASARLGNHVEHQARSPGTPPHEPGPPTARMTRRQSQRRHRQENSISDSHWLILELRQNYFRAGRGKLTADVWMMRAHHEHALNKIEHTRPPR